MRERTFQPQCYGVRRCVARGLCRNRFLSTRRKVRHRVTRCLAKTSYPTSGWDVPVTNGHSSRTVLPLTRPEIQKLAAWEPAVRAKHFFLPNSPDLNTVNLPSGELFSRRTIIKVSSQLTKWREIVKSMHETTAWRSHCHHFYHLFVYG